MAGAGLVASVQSSHAGPARSATAGASSPMSRSRVEGLWQIPSPSVRPWPWLSASPLAKSDGGSLLLWCESPGDPRPADDLLQVDPSRLSPAQLP